MKNLVDILARELKEWPEGVECATQDPDKEIRFRPGIRFDFYSTSLANDAGAVFGSGVEVSRAQWQAAVDALKAGEQQSWDVEDLPPVGAVCEHCNLIPGESWTQVEIVAHRTFDGDDYPCAIFVYRQGSSHSSAGEHFRPIRTAEQIAAEERAAEVAEMIDLSVEGHQAVTIAQARILCTQLHKAGYRKQVQP